MILNEDGNLERGHISCHEKPKLIDNIKYGLDKK